MPATPQSPLDNAPTIGYNAASLDGANVLLARQLGRARGPLLPQALGFG